MLKQVVVWILQDKHKEAVKGGFIRLKHVFTDHPQSAGETYLGHLWFTLKMAARFFKIGLAIVIHGIFPFLCTRTASDEIKRIYAVMVKRAPEPLPDAQTQQRVAIIGGGFSGALAMVNLVENAECPVVVEWFEPSDVLGTGLAYGTSYPEHLLNVRAGNMGALADDPAHFYLWLQSDVGKAALERLWPQHVVTEHDFVPRVVYAAYVQALVNESLHKAALKQVTVVIHRATVEDVVLASEVSQQLHLIAEDVATKEKQQVSASAVIVATGNLAPRLHRFISEEVIHSPYYVHDVWHPAADSTFPTHVNALGEEDELVIIGTGLTMVDTVMTLVAKGYKGKITAISRSGWLPHAHDEVGAKPYLTWTWVKHPESAPKTALGLLLGLRAEVRKAAAKGVDWRRVVDSLRPVTQILWQQLPVAEQKKFHARLFTLWNIHRHRMAPEIALKLETLQKSGRLHIVAGRINAVTEASEGLHVNYNYLHDKNVLAIVYAKMLVNCTGPDYDLRTSGHALLQRMLAQGLIQPSPLGIGISMTAQKTAQGKASSSLIPLGTLVIGELFECTAVPDLRQQTHDAACRALAKIS